MTEQWFLLIKVYDLDRLIADVEMIDGKMHVISYDGQPEDFEDLRPRQAFLKALLKAKKMGLKGPLPKSEWEAVSDQELYDSLPEHLAALVWAERVD
jgi:hypothetical protein